MAVLRILQSMIEPGDPEEKTVFDVPNGRNPTIPFEMFYYDRLVQYMMPENDIVFALALSLVIRVTAFGVMPLTGDNIHRLFGAALVISIKFLMDHFKANTYYAKVIGISPKELNVLEKELLKRLDYRIQTECTTELINEVMHYEDVTYIKKITPIRAQQFIKDIQACRIQQVKQKMDRKKRNK